MLAGGRCGDLTSQVGPHVLSSRDEFEAQISGAPFSLTLRDRRNGRMLVRLGANGHAVGVRADTRPVVVGSAPVAEHRTAQSYGASYVLDRNREGQVDVRWVGEGSLRLSWRTNATTGADRHGLSLAAMPGERYTGLLERVVDGPQDASWRPGMTTGLDLRGQRVEMFIKPTVSLYVPFYLSSAGYGLFVEGSWPGEFDMAASRRDEVRVEFEGDGVVAHIIPGRTPLEILGRYSALAGRPVMPPRWIFEPWRYRDELRNARALYDGTPYEGPFNAPLVEDVLMYEALDMPLGVYLIDRPWAVGRQGYDDFTWDPERFPSARAMIQWLARRGLRLMLWLAPWVNGSIVEEARSRGFFLPDVGRQGSHPHIDFTNAAATAWWQRQITNVIRDGVAGFKIDRGEEEVPASRELAAHDRRTMRELHNEYPRLYAMAAHDALAKARGTDFALMARAASTGSQSQTTLWAGDTHSSEWGLRSAILAAQRAAVLGFPLWGSDIGGYHGGLDREILARWIAFGCFTPIMLVGPTANRAPWDMPSEPRYDGELLAILRLYSKLHSALAGYGYRLAQAAHETAVPIIRPMFVAYPTDPRSWEAWDQYLYGPDILVAPVWRKGRAEREVHLPKGRWEDLWDRTKQYDGPRDVSVSAPLHRIPVFVRTGARLQLPDLQTLWRDSVRRVAIKPELRPLIASIK